MPPQTEYVVVAPDGPCPCRSGRTTAECCVAADGTFRVKFFSPLPTGEITGFSHPDCFMRDTRNCSEDIATGDYLSKGVLDLAHAGTVRVSFEWEGATLENLSASIVCSRHNAGLASLDAVAIQAFNNIVEAMIYVTMKSLATKKSLYAVSGEGLELWALKVLFGAAAAEAQPIDFGIFRRALESGALAPPRGLYIRRPDRVSEPRATDKTDRISGLRFNLGPLEFELIVDPAGLDPEALRRQNYYRPSSIDLTGQKRGANIFMSGPGFAANEAARLTLFETRPGDS